ncbi:MAG TPA: hypothetical protein PK095_02370 [Myxococcota bacterium]|nr:hypothetical protein [Myxococcota bacterium]
MRIDALVMVLLGFSTSAACFQPPLERDADEGMDTSESDAADDGGGEVDGFLAPSPTGLTASDERVDDVELSWSGGGQAFWVYRCDGSPCSGEWLRLTAEPVIERTFRDTTALAPGVPQAPTLRVTNDSRHVDLSWDTVVAPSAPRYSYRVTAVVDGVESAPSAEATGHRAERPVTGYEVSVAQGDWVELGSVTTWRDESAEPPALSLSGVEASQGDFAGYVELVASGVAATAGPTRSYRVRAVTDFGLGASAEMHGRRTAPAVTLQWHRSELEAEGFEDLPLATTAVAQDTGAPADGSARYYRVVLSGAGAASVYSQAVAGWRQPPPGVPGGLTATTELGDRVRLSWQAVSGALGYHVYRGEERLTSGGGITTTSFEDFDTGPPGEWAAPGSVTASTDRTDGIEVSWVAPVRPVGSSASYSVSAVNPSGEGARSASVTGRRAAPALEVWEVEVDSGETRTEMVQSSVTQWLDEDAPWAQIVAGTITATQGDHRAFVRLSHSGAAVTPAAIASYRVRARLIGDGGTAWSEAAAGRRTYEALTYRWERSTSTVAQGFVEWGMGQTFNDSSAPIDGARRWYRSVVSAPGADTAISTAVEGWRLAFVKVAAGDEFTCALTPLTPDGGRVWCWGANTSGQLGRGHTNIGPSPQRIPNLSDVRELATGPMARHVCAVKADDTLWCWGDNSRGTIGDGTFENRSSPTLVSGLSSQSVRVGDGNTCSRNNGQIHCWGDGTYGDVSSNQPGSVGNVYTTPARVYTTSGEPLNGVRHLAVGSMHGCATSIGGDLWCWGYNDSYQLGITLQGDSRAVNPRQLSVVGLYAGGFFNCGHSSSGSVSCWGANDFGALGQPPEVTRSAEPLELPNLLASELSLGAVFGCAVVSEEGEAQVRCWGQGNSGQLGNGSTTGNHVPQTVLMSPGAVALTGVTAISAGTSHACALVSNAPYCWGGAPPNSTRAVATNLP